MTKNLRSSLIILISLLSCNRSTIPEKSTTPATIHLPSTLTRRPASIGLLGDAADVTTTTVGGIVLMGGSTDVSSAFKWMIGRSGGGDVVIIRASGTDAYNPYVSELGKVNSVETLKIDSRALADNDTVAAIIRNAEMLFIAGGDQSNYMNYWRDTKTAAAINYLLTEKKVPVGGTSAGCAVLGGLYYSGESGSATSAEALQDPYGKNITLYNNDFLRPPFLQSVITDQHYLAREREGRSVVFLARILKDWKIAAHAIAADERTAVCIDDSGRAKVFGNKSATRPFSNAYFINTDTKKPPEKLEAGKAVQWRQNEEALDVYEIVASETGNGSFDVMNFDLKTATGGKRYWWWVDNGVLHKKEK